MNRTSLIGLSFLGISVFGAPALCAPEPAATSVTLRVQDHSGRTDAGPLILASSLNGWNPGDTSWALAPAKGDAGAAIPGTWDFTLELSRLRDGVEGIEFKFARGNWNTVEVNAEGGDVGNRVLEAKDIRASAGQVVLLDPILGFADQRGVRWPELPAPGAQTKSTVTGTVDIFDMKSEILGNTRKVRVWTPPGYADPANQDRHYPVLYMHDGQNCFDSAGSFAGSEWQCDEAATDLIKAGSVTPMMIVAMDNTGGTRAEEYNPPYTRYLERQNRGDRYLRFVIDEVMPLINSKYRTLTGREHTGMGGSSFGGNATLYAVMERPDVFGLAIVESAAVFLDNKAIVQHVRENTRWPLRMYMAVGTAETARSGDSKAFADVNLEVMDALRNAGMGEDRLKTRVEEGARHFETAWAKRFPEALGFVFAVRPPARP